MAAAVVPITAKAPNAPIPGIEPPFGTRKVTLCSVFFQPCERFQTNVAAIRPDGSYGGLATYTLPAAPRDGYVVMDVWSGITWVNRWLETEESDKPELTPRPIAPESIVEDLLNRWAKSQIGSDQMVGPGIGVIAGDAPTENELAQLRLRQETWCQTLVDKASSYAIQGKHNEITDLHRNAARWLMSDAADQLTWMNKKTYLSVKNCPACGEQIMASAIQCRHCTCELPKFYRQYKLDVAAKDPAVWAFMQEVAAAQQNAPNGK